MKIIGLTGSIGMGKSTTAKMFAELGCPVFDADAAVHTLYAKGGRAVPLIRAVFPDAVIDGAVDRKRLGHHMRAEALASNAKAVIFDIPLLFETGGDTRVDATIVVTAPAEVQRDRVMSRRGMTEELFQMILSKQMPDAEKCERADYIIHTDQGLEAARTQVAQVLERILHT